MALDRLVVLDMTLRAAGLPISGVSLGETPPGSVTISWVGTPTQEQLNAAEAIVNGFDYRPRRDLSPGAIATQIAALTIAQEVALRRRILARVLLANLQDAQDIITALNLPLAVEEVVP